MFNFCKQGFFVKPADHYAKLQYFVNQLCKFVSSGGNTCTNDRLHLDFHLQLVKTFVRRIPRCHFSKLVLSNTPSHKYV